MSLFFLKTVECAIFRLGTVVLYRVVIGDGLRIIYYYNFLIT